MSRCSIVVSIPACHVDGPSSILGNSNFILWYFKGGQRRTCHAGTLGSIPNNGSLTKVGTGLLFVKYGL